MFIRPKRKVHVVFIHCSASDTPEHDDWKVIDSWHKERGWAGIGYHYYIKKSGQIQAGRDLEVKPAAQKDHNTGSIAICLGGLSNFTLEQFNSLVTLCRTINHAYDYQIRFRGHCEISNKACPVFNYKTVLDLDQNGKMPKTIRGEFMPESKNKPWYLSRTLWGVALMLAGAFGTKFGLELAPADQAEIIDQYLPLVESALVGGGGILAVVGRLLANKSLK